MPEIPVGEPLETKISEPEGSLAALNAVGSSGDLVAIAASYPTCLAAWASLGDAALERGAPVTAYAYYRVGYHRGLDRIRQAGWRGRGSVPWAHEENRGFLRSLKGLSAAAAAIGENDEAERCSTFLRELASDAP
jgi:hypothetical protein